MPLGDSITAGTLPGGYRAKFIYDNARFMPVGSSTVNPPSLPALADRTHHEGHPGFGSDTILAALPGYWAANPAQFVLLHIGTNDALGQPATFTATNIAAIVDYIHAQSPGTFVYVAGVINADSSATSVNALLDAQRPLVQALCAARPSFTKYVAMPHLSDAEMDGGLHPNTLAAYAKMADAWTAGL